MTMKFRRSLASLIKHNKEGAFSTHANRAARLRQMGEQLLEKYTGLQDVRQIKTRHVDYLVARWQAEGLGTGTIKNRMSDLRWLAEKIDKHNIVKRDNSEYGIARRVYTRNDVNIAKTLNEEDLARISNPYVERSLRLQAAFGLRREEAIKFNPQYADKGSYIRLKDTWCKGGRYREIPILNTHQRELLDEVKRFCREHDAKALIPPGLNYKQQLKAYEHQTERKGLHKNHGLRHHYAQTRYRDLTGWDCPKCGGMLAADMTPQQREIDTLARLRISNELGHNREDVTNVYLGGKRDQ